MNSEGAIQAFEQCARAFCSALESPLGTGTDALRKLRDVLLPLYTAALALTLPAVSEGDLPDDAERITRERKAIEKRLIAAGFQDRFWVMFYPLNLDQPEPVGTSLSDGLADIWRDLKPGLEALDINRDRHLNHALWEWRFSFQAHWGRHAIDALRAIHFQLEDIG